jgi:DNA-binding CsgD family transcriptional regulator
MELFELNTMEAGLALQIARGRTLTEAALALKLSEQTARTYSKQIFAKTGTHRQAELVRLILTSVVHLSS